VFCIIIICFDIKLYILSLSLVRSSISGIEEVAFVHSGISSKNSTALANINLLFILSYIQNAVGLIPYLMKIQWCVEFSKFFLYC